MENLREIKNRAQSNFSSELKAKLEDFVIKDKSAFITLIAESSLEARKLEYLKLECEKKVKELNYFQAVYVTFTIIEKKFKNIIAVTSCKGGVGKSTIASNLAITLNNLGCKIGILDADIYGPSIPKIFNLKEKPNVDKSKKILPLKFEGIEIISIGLMIDEKKPIIWRGPMIQSALMQLVSEVKWSNLDFLIIDLPPGTGDPHLTLLQKLKVTHSLVVTTNDELALSDTRKGINMLIKLNVPITGVIENMSYFQTNNNDEKHYIFGEKGTEELCKEFNLKLLEKIPIYSQKNFSVLDQKKEFLSKYYSNVGKIFNNLIKQVN